ncbi:hypothetical protein FOA52_002803 [Chlamydomonas sp. UWO 241]|nr:hypothetical protein FOA52_002803 [Chlamydomonas sp. UWO 241]
MTRSKARKHSAAAGVLVARAATTTELPAQAQQIASLVDVVSLLFRVVHPGGSRKRPRRVRWLPRDGCYPGEEEAAKAAEQVTAAVKSGVSLPICLASGLVRYLHQIRGSVYAPVGGGVVSASFLNAKNAVGGIGVEPRRGDMLRVLFAVESDAVADAVVRNR